jgi:hypothetical protein
MTLILDALYGLGIINMIEHIPAKNKIRGYPMLQISLSLIVKINMPQTCIDMPGLLMVIVPTVD